MILAHHDVLFLAQGTASIGLASWAAAIGARWYSITHRRPNRADPVRRLERSPIRRVPPVRPEREPTR